MSFLEGHSWGTARWDGTFAVWWAEGRPPAASFWRVSGGGKSLLNPARRGSQSADQVGLQIGLSRPAVSLPRGAQQELGLQKQDTTLADPRACSIRGAFCPWKTRCREGHGRDGMCSSVRCLELQLSFSASFLCGPRLVPELLWDSGTCKRGNEKAGLSLRTWRTCWRF